MSNLPPIDTTIDMMKNDIMTKYQAVSRDFSNLKGEVNSMNSVDTDRLTAVASELRVIIKRLDTINALISRADQIFKKKLIGLVAQIKTTAKNTSGSNQNLRNFINGINSRKGAFGFGTKWNVTEAYNAPRIIDMTSILQRMTKLRNDLQAEVNENKAQANRMEANRLQAEREAANAKRAQNKRTATMRQVGNLMAEATTKLNAANKRISGASGGNAAARKIQSAFRAKRNRNLNEVIAGMA